MARSLSDDMDNPLLFDENKPGEYSYTLNEDGSREVTGHLVIADDPQRDPSAQRAAGGESRRESGHEWGHDDGGHIIAARFGGAPSGANLMPQDSNFNRGSYKRMENDWANHLSEGDKVFVHMETSEGERPEAIMGYAIIEHPDGTRDLEHYSYLNESISQQEQWREGPDEYVDPEVDPLAGVQGMEGESGASNGGQQPEGGEDMDDGMDIE